MQTIETERLLLRPWRMEDLEDFNEYSKNPQVGPNAGWKPHESMEESKKILSDWLSPENEELLFALEEKENHKVIGGVGIHNDGHRQGVPGCKMMGYVLSTDFWGKGFMTEAANAAMDYAFRTMKVKILTIYHYPFNSRSRRVIEKCGFRFEGVLRMASAIYDGTVLDDCCYSMTAADYYLLRAKQGGFSLKLPEEVSKEEFLSFQEEWGEEKIVPTAVALKGRSYEDWLHNNVSIRTCAPSGFVTGTSWFFVDGEGKIVGAADFRHELNERLLETGGHIGYGIRPTRRGKNLAPFMLALSLEKAKERGIDRVLVTCNEDNAASASTIEACGGVMENRFTEEDGNLVRRYWISL